jgi:hypothetical protein
MTLPFSAAQARDLDKTVADTIEAFKKKEAAERPMRMAMVEYDYKGDEADGDVMIEVFCNPNAYENAFQAKVK